MNRGRQVIAWAVPILVGIALYLPPWALQDPQQRADPIGENLGQARFRGEAPLNESRSYSTPLPAIDRKGAYEQYVIFPIKMDNPGEKVNDFLVRVASKTSQGTQSHVLFHFKQERGETTLKIVSQRVERTCPCPAFALEMILTVAIEDPENVPYDYVVSPLEAVSISRELDSDHDGIVNSDQWHPSIPQYVVAAIGILLAGCVAWYAVTRLATR